MSTQAMIYTMKLDGLNTHERLLLVTLAYYCFYPAVFCSPTLPTLKEKTGMSDHYLRKTMAALVGKGLVEVVRRRSESERWKNAPNTYRLKYLTERESRHAEDDGVNIWELRA